MKDIGLLNYKPENATPFDSVDFAYTELGKLARSYDFVYIKLGEEWCKTNFDNAMNIARGMWRAYKAYLPIALEPEGVI